MAPGARSKFGAPMFEPDIFRKHLYCIEKSTCDIIGTFRRPRSDSAPGELCPLGKGRIQGVLWRIQGEAKGAEAPPKFFQIRFLIDGSRHRNIQWGDFLDNL